MLHYSLRVYLSRKWLALYSCVVFGVAFGCSVACQSLLGLLESNFPVGVHATQTPYTIFQYSKALRLDFLFSPPQIKRLQRRVEGLGTLVGSHGGAQHPLKIMGMDATAAVDVVTPNFFDALKIRLDVNGLTNQRFGPGSAVLSPRLLKRYGIAKVPERIMVNGEVINVVGVAPDFAGLWNRETEVWLDWSAGQKIFFPTAARTAIDDQPPLYWVLALPDAGRDRDFLRQVEDEAADPSFLEFQFDSLRIIPGISNQSSLRNAADDSANLYIIACALMLIIALAGLTSFVAMIRVDKLGSELTLINLGINRYQYVSYEALMVAIPVALGVAVSLPIERLVVSLLLQDPAVSNLMDLSGDVEAGIAWGKALSLGMLAYLSCLAFSVLVARYSGVKYGAFSRVDSTQSKPAFRAVLGLVSAASASAALYAATLSSTSINIASSLDDRFDQDVWSVSLVPGDFSVRRQLVDADIHRILDDIRDNFDGVESVGYVVNRPFGSLPPTSRWATSPYGDEVIGLQKIETSMGGLSSLGINIIEGRPIEHGAMDEALVDERAALTLKRQQGAHSAIGIKLYDEASRGYRIVGVTEFKPYTIDPSNSPLILYAAVGKNPPVVNILIRTSSNLEGLVGRRPLGEKSDVVYSNPVNLDRLARNNSFQYKVRAVLCLFIAIATLAISLATFASIVALEFNLKRRSLVIRRCLGQSMMGIMVEFQVPMMMVVGISAFLGMSTMYVLAPNFSLIRDVGVSDWLTMGSVCMIVILSCVTAVAGVILTRRLRDESICAALKDVE